MRPPSFAFMLHVFSLLALPSGDLVAAVSLPTTNSGSSSTPRNALTSVAGDAIHIDDDSPPRTDGGNESGRKWRAARRQMLRRVFMLLSSPGDDDRERRVERVAGTKVNGGRRRGGSGSVNSPAVVAKSVNKVRRPTTGNDNMLSSDLGQRNGHHTLTNASIPNGEPGFKSKENDINIVCPEAEDGIRYFRCPTPDSTGVYYCIDDHALCDQNIQCPNGEDEDPTACMFHQMAMNYFKLLMDSFIALAQTKN